MYPAYVALWCDDPSTSVVPAAGDFICTWLTYLLTGPVGTVWRERFGENGLVGSVQWERFGNGLVGMV